MYQLITISCFFRNRDTNRDEFIFYSKRLMRLLIEKALSMLPYKVKYPILHILISISKNVFDLIMIKLPVDKNRFLIM